MKSHKYIYDIICNNDLVKSIFICYCIVFFISYNIIFFLFVFISYSLRNIIHNVYVHKHDYVQFIFSASKKKFSFAVEIAVKERIVCSFVVIVLHKMSSISNNSNVGNKTKSHPTSLPLSLT